jgi:hypothetical protein
VPRRRSIHWNALQVLILYFKIDHSIYLNRMDKTIGAFLKALFISRKAKINLK